MKRILSRVLYIVLIIAGIWTGLTIWVQFFGQESISEMGGESATYSALLVYNPDPIYNLDAQVCRSYARGLCESDFSATIATTGKVPKDITPYDLFVICANTYNWAPDWKIMKFVRTNERLGGKPAVALTLGSGSTSNAMQKLEKALENRNMRVLDSHTLWLLRPNDESRLEEKNTDVAQTIAFDLGSEMGMSFASIR